MSDKKERIFRIELSDSDPRDRVTLYLEDVHVVLDKILKLKPEDFIWSAAARRFAKKFRGQVKVH